MTLPMVCGWDVREPIGFNLAMFTLRRAMTRLPKIIPLMEKCLRSQGLYRRPDEMRGGQRWCKISDAPMATSFANSRFLTPWLATEDAWAVSLDFCDMLFLRDPAELFALADDRYAVMVVKHHHEPTETLKMDAQVQTRYARKNWSSVILWNLAHPANARLTLDMVNSLPGRELHAFCWLNDDEIGALPGAWNHLVGHDPDDAKPALLHYTSGTPELGVNHQVWAEHWLRERSIMESARLAMRAA